MRRHYWLADASLSNQALFPSNNQSRTCPKAQRGSVRSNGWLDVSESFMVLDELSPIEWTGKSLNYAAICSSFL